MSFSNSYPGSTDGRSNGSSNGKRSENPQEAVAPCDERSNEGMLDHSPPSVPAFSTEAFAAGDDGAGPAALYAAAAAVASALSNAADAGAEAVGQGQVSAHKQAVAEQVTPLLAPVKAAEEAEVREAAAAAPADAAVLEVAHSSSNAPSLLSRSPPNNAWLSTVLAASSSSSITVEFHIIRHAESTQNPALIAGRSPSALLTPRAASKRSPWAPSCGAMLPSSGMRCIARPSPAPSTPLTLFARHWASHLPTYTRLLSCRR
ncbi:hypothetical protein CLOM_g4769 [Closterium sp. NIES-68]|nr:hypothetical protein CLOM_g4769 [Closterium sp. NIES-68]